MPTTPATSRFGQRDVAVPGADDDVDRADGLGAVGQRGDRLRTADAVHLVDPDQRRRRERGLRETAVGVRGDAQHEFGDPRELGGDRGHEHGRRVCGAATGHVEPGPPHRHRDLAQHDAVALEPRLGRGDLERVVLADAVGGDLERGAQVGRDRVERVSQLGVGDTRIGDVAAVEPQRSAPGPRRLHGRARRRGWRAPTSSASSTASSAAGRSARERAGNVGTAAEVESREHGVVIVGWTRGRFV